MTDTITVTGVAPTGQTFDYNFTGMGNYNSAGSSWSNPAVADAQHLQYQVLSMEDGSYTKNVFAGWLTASQKGRESIPTILKRFAQMETLRYGSPNSAYYTISKENYQNTTPGNQFTANAFSPFLGLWHYMYGEGAEMSLNITQVGLSFDRGNLTPVNAALNNYPAGDYSISGQFGKSIAGDNLYVAALLGRISILTEGQLRINESGTWTYVGVVRAYNDTYDANFDPSRGVIAQASTTVLGWFNGKSYPIALPGEIKVNLSGKR
ncbi:lipid II-degrading bacteriocin [Rahnella aceris]|uniref:lipid II-degrading bacteriocin n=1 Tax=Rahnella sp. (strain Y9602) TaxID=2703885 RepID=UPI001C25784E|nr:lipid II-degrading bacteriocin [Rahnella aceris]MBU9848946.1 lipid II-degrading bacteriocin [Rahnella aceris]